MLASMACGVLACSKEKLEEEVEDEVEKIVKRDFNDILRLLMKVDFGKENECPDDPNGTYWAWSPANNIAPGWPGSACDLPPNVRPSQVWVDNLLDTLLEIDCRDPKVCPNARSWWGLADPNCNPYLSFFRKKPICPTEYSSISLINPKVDNWMTDSHFTKQFLSGLNPLKIRKVLNISELDSQLQTHLGKDGAENVRAGRIYMADYAELESIPLPDSGFRFYSPQVLWTFDGTVLRLDAILLRTNNAGVDPHFLDASTAATFPNRWLLAKMHVLNADSQIHEWVHHLPLHFMIECVAVATHNILGAGHRIGNLLAPHLKTTVFIDWAGKRTLIKPTGSIADSSFAVGLKGALKLGGNSSFEELDFPAMMEKRGFAKDVSFPNFNFKVDGFKLWEALEKYIEAVVKDLYDSDLDVEDDPSIQAWAASITNPNEGGLRGFPANISTRDTLSKTLTMVVFGASVLHQAINIPHFEYSYVPHRPTFMKKWMPDDNGEDLEWQTLVEALPTVEEHKTAFLTANLLAIHSECNLLSHFKAKLTEDSSDALKTLVTELEAISEGIKSRFNSADYPYLDPARVACSIDH